MEVTQDAIQLFYWSMASGFLAYLIVFMIKLFVGGRW